MIQGYDGTIRFNTQIDDSELGPDLEKVKGKLRNAAQTMRDLMQGPVAVFNMVKQAVGALASQASALEAEWAASETAVAILNATLKATGANSWTTAKAVQEMADKFQTLTGYADDTILSMQNVLLGFKNIKGDNFEAASLQIINMAKVMRMDLSSAAQAVGKALDDPIAGIDSLTRQGFRWTEQEKEMLKEMVKAGKTAEAQKIIIDALATTFGGAAEAANQTASAIKDKLNVAQGELKEEMGRFLTEALKPLRQELIEATNRFTEWFSTLNENGNAPQILEGIAIGLASVTGGLIAFLAVAKGHAIITALATALKAVGAALTANPMGLIAAAITMVLIPAIIYLVKNWDEAVTVFNETIAKLKASFAILASKIEEAFVVGFNGAKIAVLSLAQAVTGPVLNGIAKLLDVLGKLPFVGDLFSDAAASVRGFNDNLQGSIDTAKADAAQAIKTAKAKQDAIEATEKAEIAATKATAAARKAAREAAAKEAAALKTGIDAGLVPGTATDTSATGGGEYIPKGESQGERLKDLDTEYAARKALAERNGEDTAAIEKKWYEARLKLLGDFVVEDAKRGTALDDSLASSLKGYTKEGGTALRILGEEIDATKEKLLSLGATEIGRAYGDAIDIIKAYSRAKLQGFREDRKAEEAELQAIRDAERAAETAAVTRAILQKKFVAGKFEEIKATKDLETAEQAAIEAVASANQAATIAKQILAAQHRAAKIEAIKETNNAEQEEIDAIEAVTLADKNATTARRILAKKWRDEKIELIKEVKEEEISALAAIEKAELDSVITRISAAILLQRARAAKIQGFRDNKDAEQAELDSIAEAIRLTETLGIQRLIYQARFTAGKKDEFKATRDAEQAELEGIEASARSAQIVAITKAQISKNHAKAKRQEIKEAQEAEQAEIDAIKNVSDFAKMQEEFKARGPATRQAPAGFEGESESIARQVREFSEFGRVINDIEDAWKGLSDDIKNDADDWSDVLGDVYTTLNNQIAVSMETVGRSIIEGSSAWDGFGTSALRALARVLKSVGYQLLAQAAYNAALGIAHALMLDFAGAAAAAASAVTTGLAATAAFVGAGVVEAMADQYDEANAAVQAVTNDLKEQNDALKDNRELFTKASKAATAYAAVLAKVTKEAASFYEGLQDMGAQITSKIIDGLTQGFTREDFLYSMQEYITESVVKAAVFTDAFVAEAAAIGKEIAAGIAGGFSSDKLQALKDRLAGLYEQAATAAEIATGVINVTFGSYDVGTLNVRGDQLAQIHNKEMILEPGIAEQARTAGVFIGPVSVAGNVGRGAISPAPVQFNITATGELKVDGREIGRVAWRFADEFQGAAYGR